jgi:hypothetical protein
MVTSSDYIQIITAGIYAVALFYTIVTFRRAKRLDQITSLDGILTELRDLDRELANEDGTITFVRGGTYR